MIPKYTSLNRYSHWDGSRKQKLDADDILNALSEDLMEFGDLQQAMRYLTQRGMETSDGNYIKGIRDLLRQLKEERQQRLERFNMGGVMADLKRQLEEILSLEQETINDWARRKSDPDGPRTFMADLVQDIDNNIDNSLQTNPPTKDGTHENFSNHVLGNIGEQNKEFIKNLPNDTPAKVKALQNYEFLNPDAQKQFLKLIEQLRKAMAQSFFKDVESMVSKISAGDIERMKDMVKGLNDMLVKKIAGEDPGFDAFMEKYGDMFGDEPPSSLDELLDQMRQQMAATRSLFNAINPDQQQQLQDMMQGKLSDPDLENELAKLSKELDFLNPLDKQYNFSGDEELDLLAAMALMEEMTELDQLEQQMQRAQYDGKMDNINSDKLQELLGDEALNNLDEMKKMLKVLEEAGYVNKNGKKWALTPRGTRSLGQKALAEIYSKLKQQNPGNHPMPEEGRFGERREESKPYEFGDPFQLHMSRTLRNALDREGPGSPVQLKTEDFEIYRGELNTRTATVLMVDLSWSMALSGSFQAAKKVAMALHNLISSTYPEDSLYVLGFSAYAREIKAHDLPYLQYDDYLLGTNMQHALILAEKLLAKHQQGTRQVVMITDGEPTAHLENGQPVFAYPPTPTTISKTLRAVQNCTRKNITLNTFILNQGYYLKNFIEQMTKINGGRIFYAEPENLGEYVLVDYVQNKGKRKSKKLG